MKSARPRRLLLVHAHPDDETINNGATMAKYADEGVEVALVTCTRGEEGEILVPDLAEAASDKEDRLAEIREQELAGALSALGVEKHWFLGAPKTRYRDSGMMGMPQNSRADVFWSADLLEATDALADYIVDFKPQVLITYDEFGGYGHPDHIQAHRVAMKASEISAARGWEIQKIYWNIMPRSVVQQGMDAMKEIGSDFFGVGSIDDLPFVKDDSLVSAVIDGNNYVESKQEAMRAHRTQIAVDGPFFALSNSLGMQVFGFEYYTRVKGAAGPDVDEQGRERDLFSGIDL
ncbi:MAG: N-acetyl-1-D-myo-inositol-2-amino-2-deoxy-alpha-D-glucopyranoside deacetylase [Actinobacteria bacterium]|nr:N-acetyl-1-D-myo-inositol-2-amino-2-deoxy-alpha-D-glucopyranoside deacetylase [Actinomycetota bacterium]